mgnify:CR=1 FL=1|jgi:hypothetical protein
MLRTPIDQVRRVARIYRCNADAAAALGITTRSFSRLCRQEGIETPYVRGQRQRKRHLP